MIEKSKENYYRALRRTQSTIRSAAPNWKPWIEYFLGALCEQKRQLEKKIERER